MKVAELFSVEGKVALVTGGSRGIGAMIARGFVENGVKTYIASRSAEECEHTAAELSEHGECIALPNDLSSLEGISSLAAVVQQSEPKLDILVNNAGATWGAPLEDYSETGWDKVVDLNLKSVFFLTVQLLPLLKSAGTAEIPARIINIASVNGMTNPHMNNYAYSASKAAVIHLTRHLATDLAAENINVNAISPGFFPSKMTRFLDDHVGEIAKGIPRGRIGTREDAAGAAIFLAAPASSWITGANVPVDGGLVANA